jgi:pimeloyl-ACP methyl ester carboxylesterase
MPTPATFRCQQVPINGLTYNVRHWGPDDAPLLLMLHGWMDSSPSFQFTVDALRGPGTCWRQTGAATDKASG